MQNTQIQGAVQAGGDSEKNVVAKALVVRLFFFNVCDVHKYKCVYIYIQANETINLDFNTFRYLVIIL